ncbi:hypothetical protein VNO77_03276 [Canavalia gladiata]|uniref:Uncharacterized protein n=1 Tax=Canavalia gladiata TaxID=3824 RepID=A0AAN9MZD9_CANGL
MEGTNTIFQMAINVGCHAPELWFVCVHDARPQDHMGMDSHGEFWKQKEGEALRLFFGSSSLHSSQGGRRIATSPLTENKWTIGYGSGATNIECMNQGADVGFHKASLTCNAIENR